MITIELTNEEAVAVQRVVDAALRGSGVNILVEAGFLQTKLKAAVEASKQVSNAVTVSSKIDQPTN